MPDARKYKNNPLPKSTYNIDEIVAIASAVCEKLRPDPWRSLRQRKQTQHNTTTPSPAPTHPRTEPTQARTTSSTQCTEYDFRDGSTQTQSATLVGIELQTEVIELTAPDLTHQPAQQENSACKEVDAGEAEEGVPSPSLDHETKLLFTRETDTHYIPGILDTYKLNEQTCQRADIPQLDGYITTVTDGKMKSTDEQFQARCFVDAPVYVMSVKHYLDIQGQRAEPLPQWTFTLSREPAALPRRRPRTRQPKVL